MEVIEVIEKEVEVIEVIERGPQGPAGAGITTLTTKGDLLYRGDTTGERLPIGTSGQILKVAASGIPEWGAAPSSGVSSVSGTAPIVSSGGATPAISINAATTSAAGSMSAADKIKLDSIASGAEVNVNADWNAGSGDAQILNKPTIPSASSSTPSALGTAAAGTSSNYARADHVHAMPTANDLGLGSDDTVTFGGVVIVDAEDGLSLTQSSIQHSSGFIIDAEASVQSATTFSGPIDFGGADPSVTKTTVRSNLSLGTAATKDSPATGNATSGQVVLGSDTRLTDARTPTSHSHTPSEVGLGNVTNAAQVTSVTGTSPIVSSGGTTPAISISAATTSAAGSMSSADKIKLDGIASGATANSSDATLLARANHTGTQAASTITGLATIATSGSASDLGSGTVPTARLGSGSASASTYLAGDSSWKTITSGATGAAASASDVVGVSGSNITGTSSAQIDSADPFVKYDTANNKLTYANPLTKPTGKFAVGVQPTTTALGTNAINIQSTRAAATDVASGNYSINIGVGKASGSSSICIDSTYAPYQGYVSGNSAVSVGPAQYATATGALALGNQNNASGTGSIAMGAYSANATADNAYAIGRETNSSAIYAVSIGYQVASPLRSQFNTRTFSSVYWGGQTTDATANVVLNLDATATNRFTISASTMVVAQVLIAANSTASGKSSFWHYHVAIRRDGSNNTVLVGAAEQIGTTQTYGSPSGWAVALTADDTNEALQLAVTGEASTTITWRATAFYRVV